MAPSYLSLLDAIGVLLGLAYIVLEIRESIFLWVVGLIMPALYSVVLFQKGIYAGAIMEVYYFAASLYGLAKWSSGSDRTGKHIFITHLPHHRFPTTVAAISVLFLALYMLLRQATDSTVPAIDALTTALSIVALWLLSRKYIEQWWLWLIVDALSTVLYISKGIYGRAILYCLYTALAVVGYTAWKKKIHKQ